MSDRNVAVVSVKAGRGSQSASRAAASAKRARELAVSSRRRSVKLPRGLSFGGVHTFSRKLDLATSSGLNQQGILTTDIANGVFVLTQATLAAQAINFGSFSWQFTLADLPDFAEFVNLFDQYRVDKIAVKFIPFATNSGTSHAQVWSATGGGTILDMPDVGVHCHDCVDVTDAVPFGASYAGLQLMREFDGHRSWNALDGKVHWRSFVPATEGVVGNNLGNNVRMGVDYRKWIDTAATNVVYHGYDMIFEMSGGYSGDPPYSAVPVSKFYFRVEATVTVSFKNVK